MISISLGISDFVLVAIHTSPSKANQEIQQLVAVYDDVIKQLAIPDVIILGDLNAACSYMSDRDWKTNHLANDKRFHWLISDCVDTTVNGGHCAYDRWGFFNFFRDIILFPNAFRPHDNHAADQFGAKAVEISLAF